MFFSTFLLFLLMLSISKPTCALAPGSRRAELFKRGVSLVPFEENNGTITKRAAHSYRIPCLVNVDGVMVAVADARYNTSNDNSFIETVVKYSVDDGKTWKTQVAIKNNRVTSVSRVVDPTVLVHGNKLYVLVGMYNKSTSYWSSHTDAKDWEPFIVVGELTKTTTEDGKTTSANIKWEKPVLLDHLRSQTIGWHKVNQFLGGVSGAIVTKSGKFLIPVQFTTRYKAMYSTMLRSDDEGKNWKFAKGWVGHGYSEPVVVEFGGKLIMSVRYDYNYRMFFESTNMGDSWNEALGTLSRVWGTSPKRNQPGSQSSLISVEIENKSVLLFTHPLNTKGRWLRDRLHLWVTDGNRIYDVGQVSEGDENSAYSSLLYKNDSLYCLHEINTNEVYSLVFAKLDGELELIKRVIKSWNRTDEEIGEQKISSKGLVGFLPGKLTDGVWVDKYLCVNATLQNGTKENNDVLFKTGNSWVEWPVSNQGQNQRYYFTNNAFTLAGTVTIKEVPKENSFLFGVVWKSYYGINDFGLTYTKDQKWRVTYGSSGSYLLSELKWEKDTEYNVALVFNGRDGCVYINGNSFKNACKNLRKWNSGPGFSYFYFAAADGTDNSNVEVSNVLLYNRVLKGNELTALKNIKDVKLNDKTKDAVETSGELPFPGTPENTEPLIIDGGEEYVKPQEPPSSESATHSNNDDNIEKGSFSSTDDISDLVEQDATNSSAENGHSVPHSNLSDAVEGKVLTGDGSMDTKQRATPGIVSPTKTTGDSSFANISKDIMNLLGKNNSGDGSTRENVFSLLLFVSALLWTALFC